MKKSLLQDVKILSTCFTAKKRGWKIEAQHDNTLFSREQSLVLIKYLGWTYMAGFTGEALYFCFCHLKMMGLGSY